MKRILLLAAALVAAVLAYASTYVLYPTEQAIITAFGKIEGKPIDKPGLHFKTPFVQTVNRIDNRVLEWDGSPQRMPTRDKVYLEIDTFARWSIVDPVKFFEAVRDERTALSRLDTMLGGATQGEVARHDLAELIRTDKTRKAPLPAPTIEGSVPASLSSLAPIEKGRQIVADEIMKAAAPKMLQDFGIKLLGVQFKRLNYSREVQGKIHSRMSSERSQIAERFRSEGMGAAAKIQGERERELKSIQSEAYRKVQEITGKADAEATRIYAGAYNFSPAAAEFYNFTRTLETYSKITDPNFTVVLSTDSELFRMMKTMPPAPAIGPLPPATPDTVAPAPESPAAPTSLPPVPEVEQVK